MSIHPPAEGNDELHGLDLLDDVADEETSRLRRGPARWLFVVAGLVVLVLAIVGITSLTSDPAANHANTSLAKEVREAKDAKAMSAEASGGRINLVYSASKDAYAVQLEGLPAAPNNMEYQVAVTTNSLGQTMDIAGLLGREPGDTWFGYQGLKDIVSVHVTQVAAGGEQSPGEDDLAEFVLQGDGGASATGTDG
jgi:hypothetical protein